jgi:serine/threonine protein phosphatase PrpC
MKLIISSDTDIGTVRDHNEDNHLALGDKQCPPGIDSLLVVADGMGGHAAGEVASQMTVDGIKEILNTGMIPKGNEYGVFLTQMVQKVNSDVFSAGQKPEHRGMGTTCTLASIRGNKVFLAHVGDSRAYLLRKNQLHQITTDHSWVEESVQQGILTREQARVHPSRNVITRAIGLGNPVQVDASTMNIASGDLLLLCSDGLNSMIDDAEIQAITANNPIETICDLLIAAANKSGGHDNTTVIAVQVGKRKIGTSIHSDPNAAETQQLLRPRPWWKVWS